MATDETTKVATLNSELISAADFNTNLEAKLKFCHWTESSLLMARVDKKTSEFIRNTENDLKEKSFDAESDGSSTKLANQGGLRNMRNDHP